MYTGHSSVSSSILRVIFSVKDIPPATSFRVSPPSPTFLSMEEGFFTDITGSTSYIIQTPRPSLSNRKLNSLTCLSKEVRIYTDIAGPVAYIIQTMEARTFVDVTMPTFYSRLLLGLSDSINIPPPFLELLESPTAPHAFL